MNWRFTRPWSAVHFQKGEPFCHIMPVRRGEIEAVEPELRVLSENPELKRKHDAWTESRNHFNAELKRPGSEAEAEKWQKLYHRGVEPDGAPAGDCRSSDAAEGQAIQETGVTAPVSSRLPRPPDIRRHRFVGERLQRRVERHHLLAFLAEPADRDECARRLPSCRPPASPAPWPASARAPCS